MTIQPILPTLDMQFSREQVHEEVAHDGADEVHYTIQGDVAAE